MMKSLQKLFFVMLSLGSSCAAAQDFLLLTGGESGTRDSNYAFAGAVAPLPGSRLGQGWHLRLWADWLEYNYTADTETVRAAARGGQVSLGFHGGSANHASWSAHLGIGQRHTRLSPDQRDSDVRGTRTYEMVLVEGMQAGPAQWKFMEGAVVDTQNNYWVRVKATRKLPTVPASVGAFLVSLGGLDYKINKLGLTLDEIKVTDEVGVNLSAGLSRNRDVGPGSFVLLELVYVHFDSP